MATKCNVERPVFLFEWKIKNFSYCWQRKGDYLESPSFVIDSIEGTKWKLSLFPRGHTDGNYIGLYLKRDQNCSGPNAGINVEVELSILSWNTFKPHLTTRNSTTLMKGGNFGYPTFKLREDIFIRKKDVLLPEDILVICCNMWKSDEASIQTVEKCFATTHIIVGRRSFLWKIEQFSTIEPDKENIICVKSTSDEKVIMSFNLSLIGGQYFEEIFQVQITSTIHNMFSSTSFYVLNTSGVKEECGQCEFWFDRVYKSRHITLFLTKKGLIAKKSLYLPEDTLTLQCECAYSTGSMFEEVQKIGFGSIDTKTPQILSSSNSKENSTPLPSVLEDNLQWLYTDGFLSDVKLKTNFKTFCAHKSILSARSPVFKAMFTNNMKEKSTETVQIDDIDEDIVDRLLFYIYTARIQDLDWKKALQLYVAADKYEIMTLKRKCSTYLADNLNPNNVCDILVLTDLHQDEKLKLIVQKFILKNDQIINSKKWKCLMETNLKLATDTLCLKYK